MNIDPPSSPLQELGGGTEHPELLVNYIVVTIFWYFCLNAIYVELDSLRTQYCVALQHSPNISSLFLHYSNAAIVPTPGPIYL